MLLKLVNVTFESVYKLNGLSFGKKNFKKAYKIKTKSQSKTITFSEIKILFFKKKLINYTTRIR